MEDLALKVKLSALWFFTAVAFVAYMVLMLVDPWVMEQIALGNVEELLMGPEMLLLIAVVLLVPLVMAVLSLTLKGSVNRWTNIIVGLVFIVLEFVDLAELAANPFAQLIMVNLAKVVALVLIVWYAWKWPKQEG
jgi:hypothetical protein